MQDKLVITSSDKNFLLGLISALMQDIFIEGKSVKAITNDDEVVYYRIDEATLTKVKHFHHININVTVEDN